MIIAGSEKIKNERTSIETLPESEVIAKFASKPTHSLNKKKRRPKNRIRNKKETKYQNLL